MAARPGSTSRARSTVRWIAGALAVGAALVGACVATRPASPGTSSGSLAGDARAGGASPSAPAGTLVRVPGGVPPPFGPVPDTRSSAPRSAGSRGAPSAPWPTTWAGRVGRRPIRMILERTGDRVRLVHRPPERFVLEGVVDGREARLRETSDAGWLDGEVTVTFAPADPHRELASLWSPGGLELDEDLAPAEGVRRRTRLSYQPTLLIDVRWIEVEGPARKAVEAWGLAAAAAHEAAVRSGSEQLRRGILARGGTLDPVPDPASGSVATLTSIASVVLFTDRFVSLHEDHAVDARSGSPSSRGVTCATFDRSTGAQLGMADVFASGPLAAAVTAALGGVALEVRPAPDQVAFATRPDAPVCLVRRGVWLAFGLPRAVAALDGIAVPYERLAAVLRPGIADGAAGAPPR